MGKKVTRKWNRRKKYKNLMYVQQLRYMQISVEELHERLESMRALQYAYIIHDQEMDKNGQPIEPHIHVMMAFENGRYIKSIAKRIGDRPERIEKWDGRASNGFSYLIHATKGARDKPQYDASEVTANFDYKTLVQKEIPGQIAEAKEKRSGTAKTLLDMLYIGIKSKRKVEAELSGSQYGRLKKQIDTIWAKRLEIMSAEWREKMLAEGAQVQTVWLYGPAGTGKTSFAKEYAKKKGQNYYISGSSRDIFQGYCGEHTLILDELRPGTITYHDLLRILDPFSIVDTTMAPSRYSDKSLACDLIIITTPFSPGAFYNELDNDKMNKSIDCFDQLWRRISVVIHMDQYYMEAMTIDKCGFHAVPETRVKNQYSETNRPAPKVNGMDLYRDMVGGAAPIEDQATKTNPFVVNPAKAEGTPTGAQQPIMFDGT